MDGALVVIWVVRLLFLALLYLFLARVVRSLLQDLRAAAREPGASLGRLVVLESPAGEPASGRSFDLDAITKLGRDVNNAIVIDDPFASADHAVLTSPGAGGRGESARHAPRSLMHPRTPPSVTPDSI